MLFGLFKKKPKIDPEVQARIQANNRAYEEYMNKPEPPSEELSLCRLTLSNGEKQIIVTEEDAHKLRIEDHGAFIECQTFHEPIFVNVLHPRIGFLYHYGSHQGFIPAQDMYGRNESRLINPAHVVMISAPFKQKVEKL